MVHASNLSSRNKLMAVFNKALIALVVFLTVSSFADIGLATETDCEVYVEFLADNYNGHLNGCCLDDFLWYTQEPLMAAVYAKICAITSSCCAVPCSTEPLDDLMGALDEEGEIELTDEYLKYKGPCSKVECNKIENTLNSDPCNMFTNACCIEPGDEFFRAPRMRAGRTVTCSARFACIAPYPAYESLCAFTLTNSNEEGSEIIGYGRYPDGTFWCEILAGTNHGDATVEVTAENPENGKKKKENPKIDCISPPPGDGGSGAGSGSGSGSCCGNDGTGGRGSGRARLGSVDVAIDLGTLPNGDRAGEIKIASEKGGYYLGKRLNADYAGRFENIEGVEVYDDGAGLRQVRTPGLLVDLVTTYRDDTVNGDIYEIRFYDEQDFVELSGSVIPNTTAQSKLEKLPHSAR